MENGDVRKAVVPRTKRKTFLLLTSGLLLVMLLFRPADLAKIGKQVLGMKASKKATKTLPEGVRASVTEISNDRNTLREPAAELERFTLDPLPPIRRNNFSSIKFAAVMSFCHGEKYEDIGHLSYINHKAWAKTNGYDFVQGNEHIMPHLYFMSPFAWLKPGMFWTQLSRHKAHEWYVWVDCDALFMNMSQSLDWKLNQLQVLDTTHIVVAKDIGEGLFNTGVLFVRNSDWSRRFFARVLQLAKHEHVRFHGWWEQFAMQLLYKKNENHERKHIQIVHERYKMNAFTTMDEFVTGESLVLHQVQCPGHRKNPRTVKGCNESIRIFFCAVLEESYPSECQSLSSAEK